MEKREHWNQGKAKLIDVKDLVNKVMVQSVNIPSSEFGAICHECIIQLDRAYSEIDKLNDEIERLKKLVPLDK